MNLARPSWIRPVTLLLLVPLLGASKCRRTKDKDGEEDLDLGGDRPESVRQSLSIVSVSPASAPAGQPFTLEVLGAGLQPGARVYLGSTPAERSEVVGSTRVQARFGAMSEGTYDVEVENPDATSSILRGAFRVGGDASAGDCSTVVVYFDLDSNTLRGDSVSTLTSKVDCLLASSGPLLVEGHCDERGTTDYNLALGQRRAHAVERWLSARGIPTSRLRTVTFGEERPADPGHDEAAWARNRRAEIKLGR